MSYARQVVEQAELMEEKYRYRGVSKQRFQISSQHYSFVVDAFTSLIKEYEMEDYDFTLRETKTSEIIDEKFKK